MSPTLALSWARLKVTEVRFDKPAARNISPESSRPFPFASVRESETPLLRLIGRLERVPFPDEPPACTKKRTSEIAGAGPNPGFFFQAEDGIRDLIVTGVQTCALPI